MPVIHVALAEVESRLGAIRHRLNRQLLISGLCPALGALLLLLAAVVLAGLRAGSTGFRLVLYGSLVTLAAVLAGTTAYLWRHWATIEKAARLADRRGLMKDRVATAQWVGRGRARSPFTAVLVADTISRAASWEPRVVAPPRFPKAAVLPLAGLVALATTPFLARHTPPPPPAAVQKSAPRVARLDRPPQPKPPGEQSGQPRRRASSSASSSAGGDSQDRTARGGVPGGEAQPPADASAARERDLDAQRRGEQPLPAGDTESPARPAAEPPPEMAARSVPARLQGLIKVAFDEQKQSSSQDKGASTEATHQSQSRPRSAEGAGDRRPGEEQRSAPPESRADPGQRSGSGTEGQRPLQARSLARERSNHSPRAGSGSSPENLFGAPSEESAAATAESAQAVDPKTFKLTLSSFLNSGAQRPSAAARPGHSGAVAVPASAVLPPLNPDQLPDDALHRAGIPPEAEGVVRRVYAPEARNREDD